MLPDAVEFNRMRLNDIASCWISKHSKYAVSFGNLNGDVFTYAVLKSDGTGVHRGSFSSVLGTWKIFCLLNEAARLCSLPTKTQSSD